MNMKHFAWLKLKFTLNVHEDEHETFHLSLFTDKLCILEVDSLYNFYATNIDYGVV